MLIETTKDSSGKADNYAYRAKEYNKINGDEIRLLDGKPLASEFSKYSLIDSTVEPNERFGQAFHIYIPKEIEYGYPWTRHGTVVINKGTFLNIRTFAKPYADYTGDFYDNSFMFDLGKVERKKETTVLTDEYIMSLENYLNNPNEEVSSQLSNIKNYSMITEVMQSAGPIIADGKKKS